MIPGTDADNSASNSLVDSLNWINEKFSSPSLKKIDPVAKRFFLIGTVAATSFADALYHSSCLTTKVGLLSFRQSVRLITAGRHGQFAPHVTSGDLIEHVKKANLLFGIALLSSASMGAAIATGAALYFYTSPLILSAAVLSTGTAFFVTRDKIETIKATALSGSILCIALSAHQTVILGSTLNSVLACSLATIWALHDPNTLIPFYEKHRLVTRKLNVPAAPKKEDEKKPEEKKAEEKKAEDPAELRKQLQEARDQLAKIQEELDKAKIDHLQKNQTLSVRNKELEQQVQNLQKQIQDLNAQLGLRDHQIGLLNQENVNLRAGIEARLAQITELNGEVASAKTVLQGDHARAQAFRLEAQELAAALKKGEATLLDLQKQLKKNEDANRKLVEQEKALNAQINQLQPKIEILEGQLAQAQDKLSLQDQVLKAREKELTGYQTERERLSRELAALQKKNEELTTQKDKLGLQIVALNEQNKSQQEQLKKVNEDNRHLLFKVQDQSQQIKTQQAEIDSLKAENGKAQLLLTNNEKRLSQLTEENTALRDQIKGLQTSLATSEQSLATQQQEHQKKLEMLTQTCQNQANKIQFLETTLEKLKGKEEEIAHLKEAFRTQKLAFESFKQTAESELRKEKERADLCAANVVTLNEKVATLKRELDQLKAKKGLDETEGMAKLRQKLAEQRALLEKLTQENSGYSAMATAAKKEIELLRAQHADEVSALTKIAQEESEARKKAERLFAEAQKQLTVLKLQIESLKAKKVEPDIYIEPGITIYDLRKENTKQKEAIVHLQKELAEAHQKAQEESEKDHLSKITLKKLQEQLAESNRKQEELRAIFQKAEALNEQYQVKVHRQENEINLLVKYRAELQQRLVELEKAPQSKVDVAKEYELPLLKLKEENDRLRVRVEELIQANDVESAKAQEAAAKIVELRQELADTAQENRELTEILVQLKGKLGILFKDSSFAKEESPETAD